MTPSTLVLQHLLPIDSVALGGFVRDPLYPTQGLYNALGLAAYTEPEDYTVARDQNYFALIKAQGSFNLDAAFAKVLRLLFSKDTARENVLSTKRVCTFFVQDVDSKFETIVNTPEARRWLEKTRRKGASAYMVTGYQTVSDAYISNDQRSGTTGATSVTAADPHTGLDASLKADGSKNQRAKVQFKAVNEQIYAVQYRKILLDLLSSKDFNEASGDGANQGEIINLDSSILRSRVKWKIYWKPKGEVDAGIDDVLEAKLGDTDFGPEFETIIDSNLGGKISFMRAID